MGYYGYRNNNCENTSTLSTAFRLATKLLIAVTVIEAPSIVESDTARSRNVDTAEASETENASAMKRGTVVLVKLLRIMIFW